LVLADHIYADAKTGKKVIAGTFNQVWAAAFPSQFGRTTYVFVSLTDLRGEASVVLRYVDNSDLSVLMESAAVKVISQDPLATTELGIAIPGFPMPHTGSYSLELHVDGERLGSVRVLALQRKDKQEDPQ